jgi:hypothetical protein
MEIIMPPSMHAHGATIAFLHSSVLPIEAINAKGKALAPGVALTHVVREDLACEMERAGGITPLVELRLREALEALADGGAKIIVCTCPKLGEIVERGAADLRDDVGVPVFSSRIGVDAALRLAAT